MLITLLFFQLSNVVVFAQEHRPEIHCNHFFYGYPFGTPKTNDLIIRESYALSNNDSTKFADWVAYKVDSISIQGKGSKRVWKADPWLDDNETLEPADYKNANELLKTDRGHQAPLGSVDGYSSYFESNYLSNITPQIATLNQGVWKKIEDMERNLVQKFKTIFVVTGPLYEKNMSQLPEADEPHLVPSGYWKIIFHEKPNKQIYTAAFIFDQYTSRDYPFEKGYTTIDEVERRTNLDFLWLLDTEKEGIIEQKIMKLDDWK